MQPAFAQIGQALERLNAFRDTPCGMLRLNVPASLGPFILRDVMGSLIRQNPGLHLDVVATDRLVDIVAEGFDAGVRLGERLSQDMIAVRIRPRVRFVVVGSPAYLQGGAIPATPADLREHACVRFRFPSGLIYHWEFARDGQEVAVAFVSLILADTTIAIGLHRLSMPR